MAAIFVAKVSVPTATWHFLVLDRLQDNASYREWKAALEGRVSDSIHKSTVSFRRDIAKVSHRGGVVS